MIGYFDELKSYQLFDPIKQHIILIKNVIFNEEINDGNSTFVYVFRLSLGPLVLSCKKHKVDSLLTIEVEYYGTINPGT